MTSSPTAQAAGYKRAHEPDEPHPDPAQHTPVSPTHRSTAASTAHTNTSNFRNVSACNRCRLRKNRCDQRLPACTACEKVNHRCVGFDPITKQEIPRSYVYYLESRVSYYESLLVENDVKFDPADAFEDGAIRGQRPVHSSRVIQGSKSDLTSSKSLAQQREHNEEHSEKNNEAARLDKVVDDISMVTVQGASDRRYLGSTSGISFARVVLAAVKSSVAASSGSERASTRASDPPSVATVGGSSMRDSYFGLSTKPTIKEAPFPDRQLGEKLVHLYFEYANPQIPILHREEFLNTFSHAYSLEPQDRTPRQLYLLNIVFAIGAGVIFGSSDHDSNGSESASAPKRARLSGMQQAQPEEYHASAIIHLSAFLSASSLTDGQEKSSGDLDDLQAVLLLAGFALLRPVAPGLWYIVGVAMRLAVDLGLHFEDGLGLDDRHERSRATSNRHQSSGVDKNAEERGKRQWMRDLRRRLWWCTYCFDRLVSTCVGRPFGITDVVVTTEFPSLLDDKYITRKGLLQPSSPQEPSYKHVTYHYLRLRLLQSEILQVLQYQQAQQARHRGVNSGNHFVHKNAPSPFLVKHHDFRSWRKNMDQRLWEWKESAPSGSQTGVLFSVQFLELNHWQAVIMLYRNSLSVPDQLAGETSPTEEVSTPTSPPVEADEDQDVVFLKCAEAGQKILKLYRQLHRQRLVNYTYLATHHLFMAGISFLYAVWHSPVVRRRLTLDDFDFTVLAATSVLGDLMAKCPPAEACRDAFERMSKATVQMCMTTPGFGFGLSDQGLQSTKLQQSPTTMMRSLEMPTQDELYSSPKELMSRRRPPPRFDMDLRDLFPDDLDSSFRPSRSIPQSVINAQKQRHSQYNQSSRSHHSATRQQAPTSQALSNMENSNTGAETFTPSVQQRQISQMLSSSPTSQPTGSTYFNVNQNSYNPDFMSNLPGLEFLNTITSGSVSTDQFSGNPVRNSNNTAAAVGVTGNATASQVPDDNSSVTTAGVDSVTFEGSTGDLMDYANYEFNSPFPEGEDVGLAMGMGFDFNQQHDWGNGQNGFDLFNGFFFDRNGN